MAAIEKQQTDDHYLCFLEKIICSFALFFFVVYNKGILESNLLKPIEGLKPADQQAVSVICNGLLDHNGKCASEYCQ